MYFCDVLSESASRQEPSRWRYESLAARIRDFGLRFFGSSQFEKVIRPVLQCHPLEHARRKCTMSGVPFEKWKLLDPVAYTWLRVCILR